MTGPGEDLFDFMAVKLELFMLDNDLLTDEESGMLFSARKFSLSAGVASCIDFNMLWEL